MHNLAAKLDAPPADPTSVRHRAARAESFPSSAVVDYEAREAAYLKALLADPLRELAHASDTDVRAIAEAALAGAGDAADPFADHARLEDALERIATTTTDAGARATAEDALTLYRGR